MRVRNTEAILKYKTPSDAPPEIYERALADVERTKPNPLSEGDRREILAEEVRAWCFGFEIAVALGITETEFSVEASVALGFYYVRLKLPAAEWTPTSCDCDLTEDDKRFVVDLTMLDSARAQEIGPELLIDPSQQR